MTLRHNCIQVPAEVLDYRGGTFEDEKQRQITYKKATLLMFGREFVINSEVDISSFPRGKEYMATIEVSPVPKIQSPSFKLLALDERK